MDYSLRINFSVICWHIEKSIGWIRLFGVGISWKNINIHPLLFSQRNGYQKTLTIKNWRIEYVPYASV